MPIQVDLSFANEDTRTLPGNDEFVARLSRLIQAGCTGRDIVHALLPHELGAPPVSARIHGLLASGEYIDLQVPYSDDRLA